MWHHVVWMLWARDSVVVNICLIMADAIGPRMGACSPRTGEPKVRFLYPCASMFFFSHERKGRRKNPPSKPTKGILKLRDTSTLSNYCFQLLCVWLFFLSNLRVIFIRAVTGNWVATRVVADNKSQGIKHMPTLSLKYTYWFMESDSPYKTIQKSMTKSAQTTFMT